MKKLLYCISTALLLGTAWSATAQDLESRVVELTKKVNKMIELAEKQSKEISKLADAVYEQQQENKNGNSYDQDDTDNNDD